MEKKTLGQRIKEVFIPAKSEKNYAWPQSFGASSFVTATQEHQILNLINECNKQNKKKSIAGDPRDKLAVYRALAWAFPFIDRAIGIHADFMGTPYVESEDERLKERIEKFWKDFRVSGQQKSEFDVDKSMHLFARDLLKQTLRDGLQPYEIEKDGRKVIGARLYDAEKFRFEKQNTSDVFDLKYGDKKLSPSAEWQLCKLNRSTRFLWGIPLIYNAEFYGEMLLRVMIARRDTHVRLGNPPSFTTIGYELPDNILDKDYQAQLYTEAKNKAKEIMDGYKAAIARMHDVGKPEDMVLMMPGGIKLDTKMFGDGAPGIQNYADEYELYALQIALTTDVPVEFLGIRGASSGLGSDFFRVMKEILNSRKTHHQEVIGGHIKHITKQWLMGESAKPTDLESFEICFYEPDISDEKIMADTSLVEAQAFNQQAMNYSEILLNLGQDAANQYAEMLGRMEWIR